MESMLFARIVEWDWCYWCYACMDREYFYCVDRVHGDRCAACHAVDANFPDESVFLMADNVWN
jgi:hypothetical protein